MPTLDWLGKKAVLNHHHEVPFHLLEEVPELSAGDPTSGNLLVQGDNLLALKALLPYYAGQVKCIYIDPPYNTGNEGWVYNDAVNSPEIREWLGKVVGSESEDLSRHDKWLCMMYPRLQLLKQFLRDDGAIFVSIDDNEVNALTMLLDEVFGSRNFAATFVWERRTTRENRRVFSFSHEYVVCYAHSLSQFEKVRGTLPLTEQVHGRYQNPDNDPRGPWQSVSANAQAGHGTASQFYTLSTPSGRVLDPPPGRCWIVTESRFRELVADNRIWFGAHGNNVPRVKKFLSESTKGLTPHTLWRAAEVGTTDAGTKALLEMFGEAKFESPKPPALIDRVLRIATLPGDIVLDSFAGSGTTAQALLELNNEDAGGRHCILVELDPRIAAEVTAERISKVINGYDSATDRRRVAGVGGGFRFCNLAEPLFDATGSIRSDVCYDDLAAHVFFTHTGRPLNQDVAEPPFLGLTDDDEALYLLYNGVLGDRRPQGGNILTTAVLDSLPRHGKRRVIYGEGCRIGAARLAREQVTFLQIPYQIRIR